MKLLEYQLHSAVAKLLAKENITVTHGDYDTASFDVKNRILMLPTWKDKGKVFYDMMIAHEVGHALYTSEDLVTRVNPQYFSILNIVEDIRIEKLIQRQYPGLPKIFNGAYKTAVEDDLFQIADRDIADLSFIDRLNLKGKCRHHLEVPMDDYEKSILARCEAAETEDDVMALYEEIVDYVKGEEKKPKPQNDSGDDDQQGTPPNDSDDSGNSDDSDESNDSDNSDDSDESNDSLKGKASMNVEAGEDAADVKAETTSVTQDAFDSLTQGESLKNDGIVMWPTESIGDKVMISYETLLKARDAMSIHRSAAKPSSLYFKRYVEYTKNLKKKVGTLIHEFERRKAAWEYSRAQSSKTGMLDINKIHAYKYDDQIFKSVTQLAQGKNHGMILYVDYSASMRPTLGSVIDQVLNLAYFCERVKIPFDVYAFTSTWDDDVTPAVANTFNTGGLRIIHLLSSSMKKADYQKAFFQMFCQTQAYDGYANLDFFTREEELGGTPLNLTTVFSHYHIKSFLKKHRVQKMNVIYLTDGESAALSPKASIHYRGQMHIPLGKKVYKIGNFNAIEQQNEILEILKEIHGINPICIRMTSFNKMAERDAYRRGFSFKPNEYKKVGHCQYTPKKGYSSYFLLSDDKTQIKDKDFEFDTDNTDDLSSSKREQNKLAKAFTKHFSGQKNQRILLRKFAEIIA